MKWYFILLKNDFQFFTINFLGKQAPQGWPVRWSKVFSFKLLFDRSSFLLQFSSVFPSLTFKLLIFLSCRSKEQSRDRDRESSRDQDRGDSRDRGRDYDRRSRDHDRYDDRDRGYDRERERSHSYDSRSLRRSRSRSREHTRDYDRHR